MSLDRARQLVNSFNDGDFDDDIEPYFNDLITFFKFVKKYGLLDELDLGQVGYRDWDNEIIVYYNNCGTVNNLIRTILHEWKHQLQPMGKYERMLDEVGYEEHPFEKEAEAAESKYKEVWIEIKPKINKTCLKSKLKLSL